MKSDIEIAQSAQMKDILEITKEAGIEQKYVEQYGNICSSKAQINFVFLP